MGGWSSKQWIGSISATAAKLSEVAPLGLTADATASVIQVDERVVINHWTSTNYGGADVTMSFDAGNSAETKLKIELHPSGEPEKKFEREISVTELLTQPFNQDLDSTGNRLVVARAPGDFLPVQFDREHLVFEPGETFLLGGRANQTELHARSASCWLRLNSVYQPATNASRNTPVAWSKLLPCELDHQGSSELQFVPIPIPQDEGVYDLQIELTPTWQQASFRARPSISRHVQIVVLGRAPISVDHESKKKPWRLLANIDPTHTEPTRSATLSQFANLTGISTAQMVGNEQNRQVTHDGESMLEMQPGGWQALPVPVDRLDRPHLIEVEFLSDQPMAMGMSLLEPDASGQIPLYGFDSGATVPAV